MVNKYKRKTQPISQEQFTKTLDILRSTDISIREAARKNREISFFFHYLMLIRPKLPFFIQKYAASTFFLAEIRSFRAWLILYTAWLKMPGWSVI